MKEEGRGTVPAAEKLNRWAYRGIEKIIDHQKKKI